MVAMADFNDSGVVSGTVTFSQVRGAWGNGGPEGGSDDPHAVNSQQSRVPSVLPGHYLLPKVCSTCPSPSPDEPASICLRSGPITGRRLQQRRLVGTRQSVMHEESISVGFGSKPMQPCLMVGVLAALEVVRARLHHSSHQWRGLALLLLTTLCCYSYSRYCCCYYYSSHYAAAATAHHTMLLLLPILPCCGCRWRLMRWLV